MWICTWAKLQGANLHKANLCEAKALNSEFNEHTNYEQRNVQHVHNIPRRVKPHHHAHGVH